METPMDDRIWKQGAAGALCIVAGMLLLGAQAGWWSVGSLTRWWPLVIVALGIHRGVSTRDGFLWIGWGTLLLLWSTHVWSWRESWPLVLVLHGVAMIVWPARGCRTRRDGSRVG
jgi:hypothetical protein